MARGSLELGFTGLAPVTISISILPSIAEAATVATLAEKLFGMPTNLAYSVGYMLAYVGTGVTIPSIYLLMFRGIKMRPVIHHMHVLGTTLDNLVGGTLFTIFRKCFESQFLIQEGINLSPPTSE